MQRQFLSLFKTSKAFIPRISGKAIQLSKSPQYSLKLGVSCTLFTGLYYAQSQFNKTSLTDNLNEVEVGNVADFKDGDMKEVQVGPKKDDTILVTKIDGKFYACGSKCSHFGAPLEKGVLFDDKVFCPWHDAAFSVITGYAEQGPVLNGIPTYEIREENGKLFAKVPKDLKIGVQVPMVKRNPKDTRRFVIVGGGPASLSAAETLRQSGYEGEIIIITKDQELPYDRTMLSKNIYNNDINKIQLRNQAFFDEYGITVVKGAPVKNINANNNTVEIEGKESIKYDKLLIATGGRPRVPALKGVDLKNVFTLRNYNDLNNIKDTTRNAKNVVIIGASFIGIECASAIKGELKDNINITIVDPANTPYERVLGPQVGTAIQKLSEKNGVQFRLKSGVQAIEGTGQVKEVVLTDGTKIPADVVILGTGIQPNTEFAAKAVDLQADGGITTDLYLRTTNKDIFAAGDVAAYPYWYLGDRVRVEHYNEAFQQGAVAAFNMLERKVPNDQIPFFWTRFWNSSLQYIGHCKNYDEVYVDGDLNNIDNLQFVAYYLQKDRVIGAAVYGRSPLAMIFNGAMQLNVMPTGTEIKAGKVTIDDIKKRVAQKKGGHACRKQNCCQNKHKNL